MLDLSKLLIHGQANSDGLTNVVNTSRFLVYSGITLPSTDSERILFASAIGSAYSGTTLATQTNIQPFIIALTTNNTGSLASLGWRVLSSSSLGGSVSSTTIATSIIIPFSATGGIITTYST